LTDLAQPPPAPRPHVRRRLADYEPAVELWTAPSGDCSADVARSLTGPHLQSTTSSNGCCGFARPFRAHCPARALVPISLPFGRRARRPPSRCRRISTPSLPSSRRPTRPAPSPCPQGGRILDGNRPNLCPCSLPSAQACRPLGPAETLHELARNNGPPGGLHPTVSAGCDRPPNAVEETSALPRRKYLARPLGRSGLSLPPSPLQAGPSDHRRRAAVRKLQKQHRPRRAGRPISSGQPCFAEQILITLPPWPAGSNPTDDNRRRDNSPPFMSGET